MTPANFRIAIKKKTVPHHDTESGEGKRRNEFAEWHVAWRAEWHNYAKYDLRGK